MFASHKKDLSDTIVELLLETPLSAKQLHVILSKEKKLTIQAIYKQLDALSEGGVLIKKAKNYIVTNEWRQRAMQLLHIDQDPLLQEGERLSHHFKTFDQLDAYWKHIIQSYHAWFEKYPIFMYSSVNIWPHVPGRSQSEEAFYRHFKEKGQHGYYLLGYENDFAQQFRKEYRDEFFHVEMSRLKSVRDNEFITVVGDLYITSRAPKNLIESIVSLLDREKVFGVGFQKQLESILSQKIATSIRIERDPEKAGKFIKKLDEYFVIPKEVREKMIGSTVAQKGS